MAPGIPDIEGSAHGHDVIPVKSALRYFEKRGLPDYSEIYNAIKAAGPPDPRQNSNFVRIWSLSSKVILSIANETEKETASFVEKQLIRILSLTPQFLLQ